MLKDLEKKLCNCFGVNEVNLSFIEDSRFGDVATSLAMINAKSQKENPVTLANKYVEIYNSDADLKEIFSKVEVAGPGFINFTFTDIFLAEVLKIDLKKIKNNIKEESVYNDKLVLVEYTDPNPFKVFHIGHLMTNIIGEFVANAYETEGANVKRINYQGDVGRHIAINIYAILKSENRKYFEGLKESNKNVKEKVTWLGQMYAAGFADFDAENSNETINKEEKEMVKKVEEINKKIYDRSDDEVNVIYDTGRAWSLEYFESLYTLLGTKFDKYIFESECAEIGKNIVSENMKSNENDLSIFEVGEEGAIIYDGEKVGLHKRVFINRNGLPTYEAKDLGNMQIKKESFPNLFESFAITASEQNDYFKVLYNVIAKLYPELKNNLKHVGHGMMRFADGKMSSRKGNIIAGDELIESVMNSLRSRFENSRVSNKEEKEFLIEKVSIAAIKYSILKQSIGKDIIFDMEKAISVEGDSGPYLQYTHARINGILLKANKKSFINKVLNIFKKETEKEATKEVGINEVKKALILNILKYEKVLCESVKEKSPQKMATYLINLSHSFNAFYNKEKIEGSDENTFMARKVKDILKDGLSLLGIYAPLKM